jgi:DNA-directed RNA polymerase II subunit RPB1
MSNSKMETKTPSKIIGVQFSILSPDEIRKNSVVEITNRDTYVNNKPCVNGLFDIRMGSMDNSIICPTDGHNYLMCPGYFGHIELAKPVFFIQHLKEIMKICRCICFACSKLLINKTQHKHILQRSGENRWEYVSNLASNVKRCGEKTDDGCGCKQPNKITLEGMSNIFAVWENMGEQNENITIKLIPEIILKMFKRISDDDIYFMGFNPKWSRPEWMICQVLPIAPQSCRPSVKQDAQQRSEDDLTHIYSNIIKNNNILLEKINNKDTPVNVIEGWTTILQHSIAMIYNNKIKGIAPMAQRSGRPLKSIMERINSKNGRIRGHLMGKRVDFSARSVITGDPNLSIRELGVPMKIAKNLTKPIVVNDRNSNFLLKLVQNGPDIYPGAKILEKKTGECISLKYVDRNSIILNNGDIVHRHLMDGDAVLFNRQPSLHKLSMMCHIVRVMKYGDTFRINVATTAPYNADFDGDEMNAHLSQNIIAETELRQLAAIHYQQISPTNNSPIIGIFQDSLLGSYRFTRKNIMFTHRDAMNLLMSFKNVNIEQLQAAKKRKISNFEILTQIFPPLTLKRNNGLFQEGEDPRTSNNVMEIKVGKYIRGQLDKATIKSSTKGILHRVFNDFGSEQCADFNDNLQSIVTEYMKTSSFSVGISDLIANKKTNDEIIQIINTQKMNVQTIIDKVHLGIFENNTAHSNINEFEIMVNNTLNKATEESGKVGRKSLNPENRFIMIVESGSKGSLINISQMLCCLGQQNVDGKRVSYGFDNRTLPHFNKYDDSPNARGFIENSFISGLTAPELFFHAMAGRIGLIDTACKTSSTGYIQRRLIKGLEDLKVEYDMTVRNSKNKIIQFKYGDDSFETTKVENQIIPLIGMTIEDIYTHYDIPGINDTTNIKTAIFTKSALTRMKTQIDKTLKRSKELIDKMINAREEIVEKIFKFKNDNMVRVPVAFQYIIENIKGQLGFDESSAVDVTPFEMYELLDEYYNKLSFMNYIKPTPLFEILYYYYLSPRNILILKRFHNKGLIYLLETILLKFKEAIVHPGEMVGVVGAQATAEPTTQLTLNTFHNTGSATKSNVTRGVPRIEEILRLTKHPKNPSMTIFLKPLEESMQDKASNYSNILTHTKLIDVVKAVQIYYDPNDRCTCIKEDQTFINQFQEFEDIMEECVKENIGEIENENEYKKSKWIIRIELDAETLLDKNITMDDIQFAISNSGYKKDIQCLYSDFNSDNLIFRIRVSSYIFTKVQKRKTAKSLDQSDEIYLLKNFQDGLLNNIVLRGVNGIRNTIARKLQNMIELVDDKYVPKDIWVLDATGSNLIETLGLEYIDYKRTVSNDIKEIFEVLGIEAARQVIFNELSEVFEFNGDVYINYHHLSLLCDRMTCNKNMVAIFRFKSGLINEDTGPISKSTFEVHTEVLLNASRHAEFDNMRGVSANIMCGQFGKFGTSAFQLVLDKNAFEDTEDTMVDVSNTKDEIEKTLGLFHGRDTDPCDKHNITIQNNISSIRRNINISNNCIEQHTQFSDNYQLDF